jgi:enoyl-CoA hydratase/carnithine racemase
MEPLYHKAIKCAIIYDVMFRCFRESQDMSYSDAFKRELEIGMPVFGSKDAREGILAQKEKRKPNFPGRF